MLRVDRFRAAGSRFFGRVAVQPVDPRGAIEIDDEADLELASLIAPAAAPREPVDAVALVTDFDGVHTDDTALVDASGRELVAVSRADGMGVELLRRAGVPALVLSRETDGVVVARARKLGVEVGHGLVDKTAPLVAWASERGLDLARVAYVGNDVNDLACMAMVGWPLAVADAHPRVRAAARLVLDARGGHGAVREACDRILEARSPARDAERQEEAAWT